MSSLALFTTIRPSNRPDCLDPFEVQKLDDFMAKQREARRAAAAQKIADEIASVYDVAHYLNDSDTYMTSYLGRLSFAS